MGVHDGLAHQHIAGGHILGSGFGADRHHRAVGHLHGRGRGDIQTRFRVRIAHGNLDGVGSAVFIHEGDFSRIGPVRGYADVLESGGVLGHFIISGQIGGMRENHPIAFCEGFLGVIGDGLIFRIHVMYGDLGRLDHPAVGEGDFIQSGALQGYRQGIGERFFGGVILGGNLGLRGHLMGALAVGLVGVLRNDFSPLIHIMHGHDHGAHQTLIGEGDFLDVRALGVHCDQHGLGLRQGVLIFGNDGVRLHGMNAGLHGGVGVRRNDAAQIIHIVKGHLRGLGHRLIDEGHFGGERAVRGHGNIKGGGAAEQVFLGINVRIRNHRTAAGLYRLHGVGGDGRAGFIRIVYGHVGGKHFPGVQESDFGGSRAVCVHCYRGAAFTQQHIARHGVGRHGMFARFQGHGAVGQQRHARFIRGMNDHVRVGNTINIDKGDFRGVRAAIIHGHGVRSRIGYDIAVNGGSGHGMVAPVEGVSEIPLQGLTQLIYIVHRHIGGDGGQGIGEGDFAGISAAAIHGYAEGTGADQRVAREFGSGYRVDAFVQGNDLVLGQRLIEFIQIMHRHFRRYDMTGVGEGDLMGIRAESIHGDVVGIRTGHFVAFYAGGVYGAGAFFQRNDLIAHQLGAVFIHIMHCYRGGGQFPDVSEGDFTGIGAVGVHCDGEGGGAVQGVMLDVLGGNSMGAPLQGERFIRQDGHAVFIVIMHRHLRGLGHEGVAEGDIAGIRAAERVHRNGEGGGADQPVVFNFLGGNGVAALLQLERLIGQKRLIVFIHIMHGHQSALGLSRRFLRKRLIRYIQIIDPRPFAEGVAGGDDGEGAVQRAVGVRDPFQHVALIGRKAYISSAQIADLQRQGVHRRVPGQRQPEAVFFRRFRDGDCRGAELRIAQRVRPLHGNTDILRCRGLRGQGREQAGDQDNECNQTVSSFHKNDASFGIHRIMVKLFQLYYNFLTMSMLRPMKSLEFGIYCAGRSRI